MWWMNNLRRSLVSASTLLVVSWLAGQVAASAQEVTLGLKLADPAKLRGIPLASSPYAGAELPERVDLSGDMPPVGNQGKQQSCVAWTVGYALKSYQEHLESRKPLTAANGQIDTGMVMSPSFIYHQINGGRNVPTLFEDALNAVSQVGVCAWSDMPYEEDDWQTKPTPAQIARAKNYRIDFWRQVNVRDIKEVKAQLNAGYPVMIGARVDRAFATAFNRPNYTWTRFEGEPIGGHAMLVVGYDEPRQAFRVINSWGTTWGDSGYCWIAYTHFVDAVGEGYVAKDAFSQPDITPTTRPTEVATNDRRPTAPPTPSTTDDDVPDGKNENKNFLVNLEELLKSRQPTPTNNTDYTQVSRLVKPTFSITNVTHNWQSPDQPGVNFLRVDGTVSIPPGAGHARQLVVYFHFIDEQGRKIQPVNSTHESYRDVNGFAAVGTPLTEIGPQGETNAQWAVAIPYSVFYTWAGRWQTDAWGRQVYQPYRTWMIAEPQLFIDNFGVATGEPLKFYVDK